MYPHRIRLRGPWECEPIGADVPPPRRVLMPCRWLDAGLAGFHGQAIFSRKFGYPGNADRETEHIWLTCGGVSGCVGVNLNGHRLADQPGTDFAFDVTQLLAPRNRLEVIIQGQNETEGVWGEVALEIRKEAYLADMRVERKENHLHVSGRAVGAAPQPLDLYVLVDGRNHEYRTIMPTPAGDPFQIELAEIAPTAQSVRVDLIHISSIWYTVELPIPPWTPS
jgi:hypothetical protein